MDGRRFVHNGGCNDCTERDEASKPLTDLPACTCFALGLGEGGLILAGGLWHGSAQCAAPPHYPACFQVTRPENSRCVSRLQPRHGCADVAVNAYKVLQSETGTTLWQSESCGHGRLVAFSRKVRQRPQGTAHSVTQPVTHDVNPTGHGNVSFGRASLHRRPHAMQLFTVAITASHQSLPTANHAMGCVAC